MSTAAGPTGPTPPPAAAALRPSATGLRRIGAALTYRDFRVIWFGAFTSTIGTWMQRVAQNWLVLTITGSASAFYLGLDAFLGEAPILLLTLIGGVVADRHDRRHVLFASQGVQMGAAFALAGLVFWDAVQVWHVLALSVVTGVAQAFGGPAYQSLLPSLVDKPDLPNAIAFNSIQFNLARVIGPLIAGATLAAFGMAACFGLNGLSFVAVMLALTFLRVRHVPPAGPSRMREELRTGFRYVRRHRALVGLAVLGFATTCLGSPVLTFLPLFADEVLGGGVGRYTQLMAFAGAGAVAGALVVAWLGTFASMGRTLLVLQAALGVLVALFAMTRTAWLSMVLLVGTGACLVMVFALLSSLVQLQAPNDLRGRVMSIYLMAFRGGMPIGSLAAGWAATSAGAPAVLTANGVALVVVAVWFLARHPDVRDL